MRRLIALLLLLLPALAVAAPQLVTVRLGADLKAPVSGRLLLFATPHKVALEQAHGGPVTRVDTSPFFPEQVWVAAQEVHHLAPGASVTLDADLMAFPKPFSKLPAGSYDLQAVLDTNHNYNYRGRGAGDVISKVVQVELKGQGRERPEITLEQMLPERPLWWTSPKADDKARLARAEARKQVTTIDFTSPALTAFWGRPIHMYALVLTPPGYAMHPERHYPTVYFTHGFGGSLRSLTYVATRVNTFMRDGQMPPMIWVFLDEHSATGTHEFADSVNNGPWGKALTTELIPHLEKRFRMDADVNGRFLNGHSSGGWATLWLQTRYPTIFGGTWSTSPDSSDFRNFTGPDLYAPHANVYHRPDGTPYPLVRDKGRVMATFEQFARLERVLGPYGGQMASFEWVFSPRGKDGRPEPMFNRDTGVVDPKVVAYWRDHYDIVHRLRTHWTTLGPDLKGKIHVIIGTADTFYLDGAAHLLKQALDQLHAGGSVTFLPGRTHFDVYWQGDDHEALLKEIAWQMYARARPHSALQPPPALSHLPEPAEAGVH